MEKTLKFVAREAPNAKWISINAYENTTSVGLASYAGECRDEHEN